MSSPTLPRATVERRREIQNKTTVKIVFTRDGGDLILKGDVRGRQADGPNEVGEDDLGL